MSEIEKFKREVKENISNLHKDKDLQSLSRIWLREITQYFYAYNFSWMGRPAIQFPQDMMAIQEIIWRSKPDLVIETGVAHGGSLIYSASLMELLGREGEVVGIDIDIRSHNRKAIEEHPMFKRISLVEGSSVDPKIINHIVELAADKSSVMVILDSNHTHEHVLGELQAYAPLVSKNNYIVVFDTLIDHMPENLLNKERPWGIDNNPNTAVKEWIQSNNNFEIDYEMDAKLLISAAPGGFIKRIN